MMELLNWLFGQYTDYPSLFIVLELVAVIFGVASVMLASKTNILVFPIGLVSTAIFVYLLWKWQLFGDMFINAYYTVMSIYGWLNWSKNKEGAKQQDHINPNAQQNNQSGYDAGGGNGNGGDHLSLLTAGADLVFAPDERGLLTTVIPESV